MLNDTKQYIRVNIRYKIISLYKREDRKISIIDIKMFFSFYIVANLLFKN